MFNMQRAERHPLLPPHPGRVALRTTFQWKVVFRKPMGSLVLFLFWPTTHWEDSLPCCLVGPTSMQNQGSLVCDCEVRRGRGI